MSLFVLSTKPKQIAKGLDLGRKDLPAIFGGGQADQAMAEAQTSLGTRDTQEVQTDFAQQWLGSARCVKTRSSHLQACPSFLASF